MLGVFLGALALTGVQHASLVMVRKAELETEKFGPNVFMAIAGKVLQFRDGPARHVQAAKTFTLGDARALIAGVPAVLAGAPFVSTAMNVRHGETRIKCQLVATTPEFARVRSAIPAYGRFLIPEDDTRRAKVCILGWNIAERLFGQAGSALGQDVLFFRASCRVVGVMPKKGADIVGTDQDEQVFVPLSTFQRRFANQTWITGVYLELHRGTDDRTVKTEADRILRHRHAIPPGGREDYSLLTARDTIKLQREALALVSTLGLISSSISFTVGGLGILSIMIVLVRARRLEIGVRRATGATRQAIVRQFLLESGLMSVAGGLLGVACALLLIAGLARFGDFPFIVDPTLVAFALGASAALGLAAGAYPAWQASRLEILDVLRTSV